MSSFVVDSDHIDFMVFAVDAYLVRTSRYHVTYGAPSRSIDLRSMTQTEIGRMLWDANVAGVEAEYGGSISAVERARVDSYKYRLWSGLPAADPVLVLKSCQFLEYQSGDAPEWAAGAVCALLDMLRNAAIGRLPGYDLAMWGVKRA